MMKNYEELDPDNQDRPHTYYEGVGDGMRYAMNILTDAFPSDDPASPRIEAILEALDKVFRSTEDRRDLYFMDHMNAEFNPCRNLKGEHHAVRPTVEQEAH